MNRYRLLLISVVVPLALWGALSSLAGSGSTATAPLVSIQPATRQASPGFVFTVTLVITGVSNLGAYEATLLYDPALLQLQAVTHPTPSFLTAGGRTAATPPAEPIINLVRGRVTLGEYSSGSATTGASGSATLAYLRFLALATGTSPLSFSRDPAYPSELLDPFGNPLLGATQDGTVTVVLAKHVYLPLVLR